MGVSLSIVIPTLNEAQHLPTTLAHVRRVWPVAEIIVVDAGSQDATVELARRAEANVVGPVDGGRGPQMRRGADVATGDWILFLHADTWVDEHAAAIADAYMQSPTSRVATFRLRFDSRPWLLRQCEWFTRFDSVFTRFGDQGILIRAEYYRQLEGFRPWPLFEDVDLLRRARRERPVDGLAASVVTSARRFETRGAWRQQLANAWLLLRFLAGADPRQLARRYPSVTHPDPSADD